MNNFGYFFVFAIFAAASRAEIEGNAEAEPIRTAEIAGIKERDKLMKDLFSNYNKESYPENATVKLGVTLMNVNFDVEQDLMNSHVWNRIEWSDNRLVWDPKETGVSVLRVSPSKIWTPDVLIYNGPQIDIKCKDTNAIVFPTGNILIVPPCKIQTYCNLTLSRSPYEEQVCMIKYGSWTFDGLTMDLQMYSSNNETKVDVSNFNSQQYRVTKNEGIRNVKYYECCKEPYIDLQFTLGFKRVTEGEMLCNMEKQ